MDDTNLIPVSSWVTCFSNYSFLWKIIEASILLDDLKVLEGCYVFLYLSYMKSSDFFQSEYFYISSVVETLIIYLILSFIFHCVPFLEFQSWKLDLLNSSSTFLNFCLILCFSYLVALYPGKFSTALLKNLLYFYFVCF